MSDPNHAPSPSSGGPQMSAGLDSLAPFHANYLMRLREHVSPTLASTADSQEDRMEEAQGKADDLVQQLHNVRTKTGRR